MPDDPFLIDLQLTRRAFGQRVSDRDKVDLVTASDGDLKTVRGRANLAQAILNRLFTRRGELTQLGHPAYGSRLHQLVGELNNARVQGLAELYIRESLAQEPRIAEITDIVFAPPSRGEGRSMLQITVTVRPVGQDALLNVTIPINLGG